MGIDTFGNIDVVLNNAGKRESIIRQFGVNVQGLFDVTQKVLPHFRKNKSGQFMEAMSKMDPGMMSTPEMIADIIYTAATDEAETLRYRAGADSEQVLASRENMSDDDFFNMWRKQLGI